MLRYTLRSLALLIPALLLAHFFGYAYGHMVAPLHAARNPLYATSFSREPLGARYAAYVGQALGADLGPLPGDSSGERLAAALAWAAPNSLGLLAIAMTLSVGVGVGLGLLAVRSDPPRIAPWLTAAATLGLATPTFFFGVLGVAFVIMWLIYTPGQTLLLPLEGYGWGRHLVLPVVALMLRPTAQIAQMTAGMMVDELGRPYVVTARSIGATERRIARRHVLRNALPAVVSTTAGSLRLAAGELIIVETLFYSTDLFDTRLVWIGPDGAQLGEAFFPLRSSRAIGAGDDGTLQLCGRARNRTLRCGAYTPAQGEEPIWELQIGGPGALASGGAIVDGRIYIVTDEGRLYALKWPAPSAAAAGW